jgi:hypothetical protein
VVGVADEVDQRIEILDVDPVNGIFHGTVLVADIGVEEDVGAEGANTLNA